MMFFNILMFAVAVLTLLGLLVVQVYVIIDSYREYKMINHSGWVVVILGMSLTLLATLLFVVAIIVYILNT